MPRKVSRPSPPVPQTLARGAMLTLQSLYLYYEMFPTSSPPSCQYHSCLACCVDLDHPLPFPKADPEMGMIWGQLIWEGTPGNAVREKEEVRHRAEDTNKRGANEQVSSVGSRGKFPLRSF